MRPPTPAPSKSLIMLSALLIETGNMYYRDRKICTTCLGLQSIGKILWITYRLTQDRASLGLH